MSRRGITSSMWRLGRAVVLAAATAVPQGGIDGPSLTAPLPHMQALCSAGGLRGVRGRRLHRAYNGRESHNRLCGVREPPSGDVDIQPPRGCWKPTSGLGEPFEAGTSLERVSSHGSSAEGGRGGPWSMSSTPPCCGYINQKLGIYTDNDGGESPDRGFVVDLNPAAGGARKGCSSHTSRRSHGDAGSGGHRRGERSSRTFSKTNAAVVPTPTAWLDPGDLFQHSRQASGSSHSSSDTPPVSSAAPTAHRCRRTSRSGGGGTRGGSVGSRSWQLTTEATGFTGCPRSSGSEEISRSQTPEHRESRDDLSADEPRYRRADRFGSAAWSLGAAAHAATGGGAPMQPGPTTGGGPRRALSLSGVHRSPTMSSSSTPRSGSGPSRRGGFVGDGSWAALAPSPPAAPGGAASAALSGALTGVGVDPRVAGGWPAATWGEHPPRAGGGQQQVLPESSQEHGLLHRHQVHPRERSAPGWSNCTALGAGAGRSAAPDVGRWSPEAVREPSWNTSSPVALTADDPLYKAVVFEIDCGKRGPQGQKRGCSSLRMSPSMQRLQALTASGAGERPSSRRAMPSAQACSAGGLFDFGLPKAQRSPSGTNSDGAGSEPHSRAPVGSAFHLVRQRKNSTRVSSDARQLNTLVAKDRALSPTELLSRRLEAGKDAGTGL